MITLTKQGLINHNKQVVLRPFTHTDPNVYEFFTAFKEATIHSKIEYTMVNRPYKTGGFASFHAH